MQAQSQGKSSGAVRKSVIDEELLEDENFESEKDPFGSNQDKDSLRTSIHVSDDVSAQL